MTDDTKRAITIIKPLANELKIQVRADWNYLYLDGQAIGIACNSSYATIMEFIGYLIYLWADDKNMNVTGEMDRRIRRYWFSGHQIAQLAKMTARQKNESNPEGSRDPE